MQLVTELAPLLADPAGQLLLAHLVRRTCDLAATEGAEAAARCEAQLAAGAAESCWRDYRAAASLAERTLAVSCLGNLRSARARELLQFAARDAPPSVRPRSDATDGVTALASGKSQRR